MEKINSYKIVLIGEGGVGKTSFINRYRDGSFNKQYIATVGAEVYNINLPISQTQYIHFQIWDTAGQEKYSSMNSANFFGAHGAIVFFDVTFNQVPEWIRKLQNVVLDKNFPLVIVGNKADLLRDRNVDAKTITSKLPKLTTYTDMSAKSNYNFDKPLLYMARKLLKDRKLVFPTNINVAPAELFMDAEAKVMSEMISGEVKAAKKALLPEEVDEGYFSD